MSLALENDPSRFASAKELHARPFPAIHSSGFALSVALRDAGADYVDSEKSAAALHALLDHYGAPRPSEGANHAFLDIDAYRLKWERHTEFETYTFFSDQGLNPPFSLTDAILPEFWCQNLETNLITSVLVQIEKAPPGAGAEDGVDAFTKTYLVPESTSISNTDSGSVVIASDFQIDAEGYVRMLVSASSDVGPRRLGRVTQRLIEIETYKSMAMLTLPVARSASARLAKIESEIAEIVRSFAETEADGGESLARLVSVSAELEDISAQSDSRFSAARAYSAIVNQRIEVLREERFVGRQTMSEFMQRRFDPAMRTCESTAQRLMATATRANRVAQLLRTRADVSREEQNQQILERMDKRAALQLKLQKTVEGLSVVAISYYAVNLASYAVAPFAGIVGLSKVTLTALLTPVVLLGVWWIIRRIRREI